MHAIVELKKEGGNGSVEVILERPIVGEPTKRTVDFIQLGKQDGRISVLQKGLSSCTEKQEWNAR